MVKLSFSILLDNLYGVVVRDWIHQKRMFFVNFHFEFDMLLTVCFHRYLDEVWSKWFVCNITKHTSTSRATSQVHFHLLFLDLFLFQIVGREVFILTCLFLIILRCTLWIWIHFPLSVIRSKKRNRDRDTVQFIFITRQAPLIESRNHRSQHLHWLQVNFTMGSSLSPDCF